MVRTGASPKRRVADAPPLTVLTGAAIPRRALCHHSSPVVMVKGQLCRVPELLAGPLMLLPLRLLQEAGSKLDDELRSARRWLINQLCDEYDMWRIFCASLVARLDLRLHYSQEECKRRKQPVQ